ncbi:hypothetical protein ACFV9C_41660 [Kribbella sp. NPDC059898]|uniref:hypothetical protein n=1 Tax=Kribbella sp. NPDC059898 TaxID=3346995 RepID=UPI00365985BD
MANSPDPHTQIDRDTLLSWLIASTDQVAQASGRRPARELLQWITRGRLGRTAGWPQPPRLDSPWQDTISGERPGWRERAANDPSEPAGDFAFAVDYQICHHCTVGWVEQPYTREDLQRGGLATAGLAALRRDHPGLAWHTLGGHISGSQPFWSTAGSGVAGCYEQRDLCRHLNAR